MVKRRKLNEGGQLEEGEEGGGKERREDSEGGSDSDSSQSEGIPNEDACSHCGLPNHPELVRFFCVKMTKVHYG